MRQPSHSKSNQLTVFDSLSVLDSKTANATPRATTPRPSAQRLTPRPAADGHRRIAEPVGPINTPLVVAILAELDRGGEPLSRELASRLRPHLVRDAEQLLDSAEKAAQLHLHPDTLTRMARVGRVPGAQKVGQRWLFPTSPAEILPVAGDGGTARARSFKRTVPRRPSVTRRTSVAAIRGDGSSGARDRMWDSDS
jgi:hypothetical protein